MGMLRRLLNLGRRGKIDAEIQAELESHIQMRTEDNLAAGTSPKQAQREAPLKFGNPVALKERAVASDAALELSSLWRDEKQRALGFITAFYAVYDPHPVPLTPKLKFRLAFRTLIDPVTLLGTAFIAGIDQASDTPDYVQGVKGYGQRFIIDGLYGNDDVDGPPHRKWKIVPFNDARPNGIFMSLDGVAIDSVGFDFLTSEWPDLPDIANADNYLREAALAHYPPSKTFYDS